MDTAIQYEVKDRIAFITINVPQSLNALNPQSADELGRAWVKFRDDEKALVAIISGAGKKSFCVGYEMSSEALSISSAMGLWLLYRPLTIYGSPPLRLYRVTVSPADGG